MYTDASLSLTSTADRAAGGQAITGAAEIISSDVIDLGAIRDMGEGEDIYVYTRVTGTFAGGTNLQVRAVIASDVGLSANVQLVGFSDVIPLVSLIAPTGQKMGYVCAIRINPLLAGIVNAAAAVQGNLGQLYFGLRYVPTGTFTTGGRVISDVVIGVQDGKKSYPTGITVG